MLITLAVMAIIVVVWFTGILDKIVKVTQRPTWVIQDFITDTKKSFNKAENNLEKTKDFGSQLMGKLDDTGDPVNYDQKIEDIINQPTSSQNPTATSSGKIE